MVAAAVRLLLTHLQQGAYPTAVPGRMLLLWRQPQQRHHQMLENRLAQLQLRGQCGTGRLGLRRGCRAAGTRTRQSLNMLLLFASWRITQPCAPGRPHRLGTPSASSNPTGMLQPVPLASSPAAPPMSLMQAAALARPPPLQPAPACRRQTQPPDPGPPAIRRPGA